MFPRGTFFTILYLFVSVMAYSQTPTPVPDYYLLQIHAQDVFLHKEIDSSLWSKAVLDENRAAGHPRGSIQSVREFTEKQIDAAVANPMLLKSGRPYYGTLEADPTNYHFLAIPKASYNPAWIEKNYYNSIEGATYEHRFRLNIDVIYDQALNDYWKGLTYNSKGNVPIIIKFSVADVKTKMLPNVEALDVTKIKFLAVNDVSTHGSAGHYTIGTTGADYTTAQAAEDAQQSDLTGAGDCIMEFITGGNFGALTILGWTTTAADQLIWVANESVAHQGRMIFNGSFAYLYALAFSACNLQEEHVKFINMAFLARGAGRGITIGTPSLANGVVEIIGCLVEPGLDYGIYIATNDTATDYLIANSIILGSTGAHGPIYCSDTGATIWAYFNTFARIDAGSIAGLRIDAVSGAYVANNIFSTSNTTQASYTYALANYNFTYENLSTDPVLGANGGYNVFTGSWGGSIRFRQ